MKRLNIKRFKKGDFIVITSDSNDIIRSPGFKEAGLLGGIVIRSNEKWEKWSDEDLAKVGLQKINRGYPPE